MGLGRRGVDMGHAQELVQDTRHVLVGVTTRHGTTLALIVPVGITVNMKHVDVILSTVHQVSI